ncbi:cation:proton antiporter [Pseudomonas indica]|uniref:cation:proton antiporter n=1 Tax=Pseudomonas indica TaxID=137658 RepID=UPI000BAB3884|nr:sodium:proton antiporter [Pseudomonas indica]MBU3057412.1 sodium:proton antiporter [Pseudomonas indica]PAU57539.1 sodium:proton antiporter [Pseudomonas indica]
MLEIAAVFISLTAALAYLNHRFVGFPPTIGVMAIALGFSLLLQGLSALGHSVLEDSIETMMNRIDFNDLLMNGMLSLLLFAGALHINLADLRERRWAIGSLATLGVLVSTALIGACAYGVFQLFGFQVSWIYCLLFGALISPTDPIAVLGIMRSAGAPKPLEITIVGESLFNDGVAVVVFTVLLGILAAGEIPSAGEIGWLFVEEAIGGMLFGALLGWIVYRMLKSIDQYQVEVLLTLALVIGGYTLATHLHLSGPIAMVVAGLIIGNQGRLHAMSDKTRENVDNFWELIDEILNAVLFVLIGMELLLLPFTWLYLAIGATLMLSILVIRLLTIGLPFSLIRLRGGVPRGTIRLLTWGGLRGGISVALALALPAGEERNLLLNITYIIVLFSILVQGLSIGRLVRHICGNEPRTH